MPKKAVFKFLMQLGGSNLWKERVQLGDLFFALWRNQYPVVLSHALAPLDQSSSWSGRIDQWSVVYEHMVNYICFFFIAFGLLVCWLECGDEWGGELGYKKK